MVPQSFDEIRNLAITPYEEIRTSLNTGDLLMCSGKTLTSRIIQSTTKSPYSHVGVVVRMLSVDRMLLLESEWPYGVRAVPLSNYLQNWKWRGEPYPGYLIVIRHKHFTSLLGQSIAMLLSELVDIMGQPYNLRRLLRIGWRELIALVGLRFGDLQIKKATVCSEYVYHVYSRLGIHLSWNSNGYILPTDIAAQQEMSLICRLR